MTLRILNHEGDPDARIVAILMHMLGVESVTITAKDDAAMMHDIEGSCLVQGNRPDGSVELRIVADDDLPDDDEALN